MRRFVFPLLTVAAFAFSGEPAAAADRIWSGLVLAKNTAEPGSPPPELEPFSKKLRNVFGYNEFKLIGQHTQPVEGAREKWLVPSKVFRMRVEARSASPGYMLDVRLFREKNAIVETKVQLTPGSPLFIRGPLYGPGQLIIVVMIK